MGIQENMAEMMRIFMERRYQSLTEFSKELEISRSTLQSYLNANGNPSAIMMEHLAQKLNIESTVLVTGLFEPDQCRILLLLLELIQEFAALPEVRKKRFAVLLLEMVQLWGGK